MVAQRRHELADLVHNLGVLTKTIGQHKGDVTSFVKANNAALSAIGAQDPNVQRALSLLPSTLSTAHQHVRRRSTGSRTSSVPHSTRCGRSPGTSTR